MNPSNVQIEPSWREALSAEFRKPYFDQIMDWIDRDREQGYRIFPAESQIFLAFDKIPIDQVRVVILGQDPYHRPDQAMGLSFSVPKGLPVPPSLRNVYKELHADVDFEIPSHGDLTPWAEQGVFLLNAMLTVREGQAGSHKSAGWQRFTDAVIRTLSDQREGVIFLLWGRFAQGKRVLIDERKHHVLMAAHPSPLARNAFSGCKHFSTTNELLADMGLTPINWQL